MPTQPQKITAATCITCHTTVNSPPFTFDVYEAHILHHPPANMPPLPPNPAMEAKKAAGH
jgi:hypothetical protein